MVSIKRRFIKGYILLESMIALSIFIGIATIVLGQIRASKEQYQNSLYRVEMFNIAQMAVQSRKANLTLDGITVAVTQDKSKLIIYAAGKEVWRVVKN